VSASGTWSRCFEAYSLRATLPVSVREIGVRWQQCWPDGVIGQLDVILVTSFAFQPRHGMPSFQTALGHGIQPSLSVDVECNMTANMFSIMRATFTLQRALVNERSLAAEQNLPPLITCRQVIEMATLAGARAAHLDRKIGSLTPGKEADLLCWRPTASTFSY
jgi:5-methylthioadenosine/S-adenosylhomocysteine deaminase